MSHPSGYPPYHPYSTGTPYPPQPTPASGAPLGFNVMPSSIPASSYQPNPAGYPSGYPGVPGSQYPASTYSTLPTSQYATSTPGYPSVPGTQYALPGQGYPSVPGSQWPSTISASMPSSQYVTAVPSSQYAMVASSQYPPSAPNFASSGYPAPQGVSTWFAPQAYSINPQGQDHY